MIVNVSHENKFLATPGSHEPLPRLERVHVVAPSNKKLACQITCQKGNNRLVHVIYNVFYHCQTMAPYLTVLVLICLGFGVECLSCFGVNNSTETLAKICSGHGRCIAENICLCDTVERSKYEGKQCELFTRSSVLVWGRSDITPKIINNGKDFDDVKFLVFMGRCIRPPHSVWPIDGDLTKPILDSEFGNRTIEAAGVGLYGSIYVMGDGSVTCRGDGCLRSLVVRTETYFSDKNITSTAKVAL